MLARRLLVALPFLAATLVYGQTVSINSPVGDFSVNDPSGKPVNFSSLRGTGPSVVIFVSVNCPVSNAYNERMNALYKAHSSKGVKFVFINSNANETREAVEEHARRHFAFPVYKDPNNVVADRFGAQSTPEVYLLNAAGTLVYHGHIDDSQQPERVRVNTLRNSLEAVTAGRPLPVSETRAFGCAIKRVKKS
ncbi:MAG: redoxin domain-containing protein [Acidobacteria bacterium]|nr:redoxin domain-containing protein [Acidobacteriota bacterium]